VRHDLARKPPPVAGVEIQAEKPKGDFCSELQAGLWNTWRLRFRSDREFPGLYIRISTKSAGSGLAFRPRTALFAQLEEEIRLKTMRYLMAMLAIAGVVVSVLALRVHYSTDAEPCSINERWDCGIVNHSPFAEIARIPVAAIGVAGYLALAGLAFLRQRALTFLAAGAGLGFALWLTFIEEYVLQVWCLYCVISLGIIVLITLLSLGWLAEEYIALKRAAC
jgi:uncharacterized membrane protein